MFHLWVGPVASVSRSCTCLSAEVSPADIGASVSAGVGASHARHTIGTVHRVESAFVLRGWPDIGQVAAAPPLEKVYFPMLCVLSYEEY